MMVPEVTVGGSLQGLARASQARPRARRGSKTSGRHEWACFAAQQAAEKGIKALHLHLGQEACGHVVARLLRELPGTISLPDGMLDQARVLDAFYIPSRYPNSHAEGPPFEHYGERQSEEAIDSARAILGFVDTAMA